MTHARATFPKYVFWFTIFPDWRIDYPAGWGPGISPENLPNSLIRSSRPGSRISDRGLSVAHTSFRHAREGSRRSAIWKAARQEGELPGTVHIVDDDPSFQTAIERRLKRAGYDVAIYLSAQQLLD